MGSRPNTKREASVLVERGYVKLWRKTLDSGLLENGPAWQLFGYLLLNAAHRPHRQIVGGMVFELEPGQVFFSRAKAAAKLGLGERQIRTAFQLLEKLEILTSRTTNKGTVVSLVNWHKYNDERPAPDQQNDQRATSTRPAPDQQTAPVNLNNKNGSIKEFKNIKIYSASGPEDAVQPSPTESAPADADAVHIPVSAPQADEKPGSSKGRRCAQEATSGEPCFITRKQRKLTGKRLETFEAFWEDFGLKKGKAEAADAWLDIPELTDRLVARICDAARQEAQARREIEARGGTPKWAQGWLTARRWEDYEPGKPPPSARAAPPEDSMTEEERQKALDTMHRLEAKRKQRLGYCQ